MLERKRKKRGIFDLFDFGEEDFLFGREPVGERVSVTHRSVGLKLKSYVSPENELNCLRLKLKKTISLISVPFGDGVILL